MRIVLQTANDAVFIGRREMEGSQLAVPCRAVSGRAGPDSSVEPCRAVPLLALRSQLESNCSYVRRNARHSSHFQPAGAIRHDGGTQACGRWEGCQGPGETVHARIPAADGEEDGAAGEGVRLPAA
jgi:hypothetical protein